MIKEPLYYLLCNHFYSSPLSLRDISPQGGERLKVFVYARRGKIESVCVCKKGKDFRFMQEV